MHREKKCRTYGHLQALKQALFTILPFKIKALDIGLLTTINQIIIALRGYVFITKQNKVSLYYI